MSFKFSEYGIKDKELFKRIYADFIEYCKKYAISGTFSTYTSGEPFFMTVQFEIPYNSFKKLEVQK